MKANWRTLAAGAAVVLLIMALKIWLPSISHSAAHANGDFKVEYFTLTVDYSLPFDKAVEETGINAESINPCITDENFPNQRTGKVSVECAKFYFRGSVTSTEAIRRIKEYIKEELKNAPYSPAGSRPILACAGKYRVSRLDYVISLGDGSLEGRHHRPWMLWKKDGTGVFGQSEPEYWFLATKDD